jgi:hypothetical protein
MHRKHRWLFRFIGKTLAATLLTSVALSAATAEAPSTTPLPGKPGWVFNAEDPISLGYSFEEFTIAGNARSFEPVGALGGDGEWKVRPAGLSPYKTRVVVMKPIDATRFNGTVVVEWLNVTGGLDVPVEWMNAHRELTRSGYAYVAISAQKVGIDGGISRGGGGDMYLKKADPARYAALNHPGDAYSYDIYSDVARVLRSSQRSTLLGKLVPQQILAIGESQAAFYLATYVNAIDPLAKVYDGFFVHSRSAIVAPLDSSSMFAGSPEYYRRAVRLRSKPRVPVLQVNTETDVLALANHLGFYAARQPDGARLRTWEIAGTAHADNYLNGAAFVDTSTAPVEKLAAAWAPRPAMQGDPSKRMNNGPHHHYIAEAAIDRLDAWVKSGRAPAQGAPIRITAGDPPKLVTDSNGNALGGVRSPWMDVPTSLLTGDPRDASSELTGRVEPFSAEKLAALYPGGKEEYLRKFAASLDRAISDGFILAADRAEILKLAALGFSGK